VFFAKNTPSGMSNKSLSRQNREENLYFEMIKLPSGLREGRDQFEMIKTAIRKI
jgi:hypothetical protein